MSKAKDKAKKFVKDHVIDDEPAREAPVKKRPAPPPVECTCSPSVVANGFCKHGTV